MSGPKRNPDKLNTIGVVVVGICGAVMVYVSIVALQAFYMNDSSEVQTMADYGGQDTAHVSLRATQINTIEDCKPNAKPEAGKQQTYVIPIKYAIKLVADEAKQEGGAANLVPTQGPSTKPTIQPIFGRPRIGGAPTPTTPAQPTDATMTPTGGQGMGGGPPPGQGPTSSPPGPPTGADTADPNPAGAPTGGNPPTPKAGTAPTAPGTAPKAGTAPGTAPKAGTAPGTAPKAGTAPAPAKTGTAPAKAGTAPGTSPAPKTAPPTAGSAGAKK